MKNYIKTGALLSVCLSTQLIAGETVYDTDGNAGRVTYYQNAPIDAMVTQSSSAYDLRVYTPHFSNHQACSGAKLFNTNTDQLITELIVNKKLFIGTIPKGFEHTEKYVEASCQSTEGTPFVLRHKIASAPKVTLNSEISVADWVEPGKYFPGFYRDVQYQAILNIDNSEPDGYCMSAPLVGNMPEILSDFHYKGFYSDVVAVNGQVDYDARSGVLVSEVICKNTGGNVRLIEIWNIQENSQTRELSVDIY